MICWNSLREIERENKKPRGRRTKEKEDKECKMSRRGFEMKETIIEVNWD